MATQDNSPAGGAAAKAQRRLVWRRRWKKLRWLLWLLLMIPFVYLAVQLFIILAPRARTETAILDKMTDAVTVTGQVVLESVPVPGAGALYYPVEAGQRVSVGAEVAFSFPDKAAADAMAELAGVERQLAILEEAERDGGDSRDLDVLLGEMQAGLYEVLAGMENGDYAAAEAPADTLLLAANKMKVATGEADGFAQRAAALAAQKAALQAKAVPTGVITAPETGYFVPANGQETAVASYETLAALSAGELAARLSEPARPIGSGSAGCIVTDYRWRFFTVVDEKAAIRFTVGDKSLRIAFPDSGDDSMPVTVEKVEPGEDGSAVVELSCEYMNPDVLQLGVEKAQIIFGELKGLRVDKGALRLAEMPDEEGVTTTYKGVYVKFGNMVYFRKINILLEDEHYMLLPDAVEEGVNEVRLYDEVVVDSGGMELYDQRIL